MAFVKFYRVTEDAVSFQFLGLWELSGRSLFIIAQRQFDFINVYKQK